MNDEPITLISPKVQPQPPAIDGLPESPTEPTQRSSVRYVRGGAAVAVVCVVYVVVCVLMGWQRGGGALFQGIWFLSCTGAWSWGVRISPVPNTPESDPTLIPRTSPTESRRSIEGITALPLSPSSIPQRDVPVSNNLDSPHLPHSSEWYVIHGGREFGPFSRKELVRKLEAGEIEGDDLTKQVGGLWGKARDLSFLHREFLSKVQTPWLSPAYRNAIANVMRWEVAACAVLQFLCVAGRLGVQGDRPIILVAFCLSLLAAAAAIFFLSSKQLRLASYFFAIICIADLLFSIQGSRKRLNASAVHWELVTRRMPGFYYRPVGVDLNPKLPEWLVARAKETGVRNATRVSSGGTGDYDETWDKVLADIRLRFRIGNVATGELRDVYHILRHDAFQATLLDHYYRHSEASSFSRWMAFLPLLGSGLECLHHWTAHDAAQAIREDRGTLTQYRILGRYIAHELN